MFGGYKDLIEQGRIAPMPLELRYCNKCNKHLKGIAHWRKEGMKSPPWLIGYPEEYVCFYCEPFSDRVSIRS